MTSTMLSLPEISGAANSILLLKTLIAIVSQTIFSSPRFAFKTRVRKPVQTVLIKVRDKGIYHFLLRTMASVTM